MTRMVDEDRMLIGTYKALGYSNARITGKYLGYAAIASGVGSIDLCCQLAHGKHIEAAPVHFAHGLQKLEE